MNLEEIEKYLLSKNGAMLREIKKWNFKRYLLNEKPFALITLGEKNEPILTVKNHKAKLNEMRIRYKDAVVESFVLEPLRWNSIFINSSKISIEVIQKAIDESYNYVYSELMTLAKKFLSTETEDYSYTVSTKNGTDFLEMSVINPSNDENI